MLPRVTFNGIRTMKKPSKTAAELEASIKVEMEDICDWPTDMTISVQPDGDSWKVKVVQEGSGDDAERREMVERIAARLKAEYGRCWDHRFGSSFSTDPAIGQTS